MGDLIFYVSQGDIRHKHIQLNVVSTYPPIYSSWFKKRQKQRLTRALAPGSWHRWREPTVKTLTEAAVVLLLVPDATDTAAQRYQPVSIGTTVQLGRIPLLRVLHARAPHFHQRRRVHVRHRVGKRRQVPQRGRTALVEDLLRADRKQQDEGLLVFHEECNHSPEFADLDGNESNASSHVLEGQVEAFLLHWSHLPDFSVEAKDAVSEVCLCETLICCYGVHLKASVVPLVQFLATVQWQSSFNRTHIRGPTLA